MTTLKDLIVAVKERNLTKDQLEVYRDSMAELVAQMHFELAEIEKECALFLDASEEKTEGGKIRKWKVTSKGQREIELKNYIKATNKMIDSLKSRLFNVY